MEKKVWKKVLSASIALAFVSGGIGSQFTEDTNKNLLRADVLQNAAAAQQYKLNLSSDGHGTIKAVKYQTDSEITSSTANNYVDINVYPDEGYYLRALRNSGVSKWYNDDIYSLGIKMPEQDVTMTAMFDKIPDGADKKPSSGLYVEYPVFENGKRTSKRIYIPVVINGIGEKYAGGEKPQYRLTANGKTFLQEGKDFSVTDSTETTSEGIQHTLTFKGLGGPSIDSKGYVAYLGDTVRGEQKVTYIENSVSTSLDISKTNYIKSTSSYTFKVDRDGTYVFKASENSALVSGNAKVISSDGKNVQKTVDFETTTFKADLKAGETYCFTALPNGSSSFRFYLTISEITQHNITTRAQFGVIYPRNNIDQLTRKASAGQRVYIDLQKMSDYKVSAYKVVTADNEELSLKESSGKYYFIMPDCDVTITAEFVPDTIPLSEGENKGRYVNTEYLFTPSSDGLYEFTSEFEEMELAISADGQTPEVRQTNNGGIATLKAGVTYTFSLNGNPGYVTTKILIQKPTAGKYTIDCNSAEGGKINVTRYGSKGKDKLWYANAEDYVEFSAVAESGYYLAKVDISSNGKKITWYNDSDSFGFWMPAGDVTITPTFARNTNANISKPASGLYREVWKYASDGEKTVINYYIPVIITEENAQDVYEYGQRAQYTLKTADGIELETGLQVKVKITSTELSNGNVKYTYTFTGNGSYLGEGLYKGSAEMTFLAKGKPDDDITPTPAVPTTSPVVTVTPDPTVAPDPTVTPTPEVTVKPEDTDDLTVTVGKAANQYYTDPVSGKVVYRADITVNNSNKIKFTAARIELEFDAPITNFMYGADIGNKTVTIDPSNSKKLIIDFTTYDPNGVNTDLSSAIAIAADTTGDLHIVSAKVTNVVKK